MRILQLVQKPQRRGAEVFASQLSCWLRAEGHSVRTAYLYGYDGPKPLMLEPGDVELVAREDHPFERVPAVQPLLLRSLRREIRAFDPQIVQMNGARTVKYGSLVKACDGRTSWKLVYRNIDSPVFWMRGRVRRQLYRRGIMVRVDGVIGVSRQTLAEVRELYKLRVPHVFIPNGVDFSRLEQGSDRGAVRESLSTPRDATVALFVGNLTRQKRPDRFLRVFAQAADEADYLHGWLLGDGPDREALEAQAAALGLTERIHFLGYQEQVAPFIDAADFFVSTSDTEGIPAVVLEIGYFGKPAVAMRVGGIQECVRDGETGLLVEPGDEEGLLREMLRLAQDEPLRRSLGEQARRWVADEFSIERVGDQYLAFYESLLQEPGFATNGVIHGR